MPRPCSIQASGFSDRLADIREAQATIRFYGQYQLVTLTKVQSLAKLSSQDETAAVPQLDRERSIVGHS